jgi:hypothetical protein
MCTLSIDGQSGYDKEIPLDMRAMRSVPYTGEIPGDYERIVKKQLASDEVI